MKNVVPELYRLFEPLAGKRLVQVSDSNNRLEWAKIVADLVENQYATAPKITLGKLAVQNKGCQNQT